MYFFSSKLESIENSAGPPEHPVPEIFPSPSLLLDPSMDQQTTYRNTGRRCLVKINNSCAL